MSINIFDFACIHFLKEDFKNKIYGQAIEVMVVAEMWEHVAKAFFPDIKDPKDANHITCGDDVYKHPVTFIRKEK